MTSQSKQLTDPVMNDEIPHAGWRVKVAFVIFVVSFTWPVLIPVLPLLSVSGTKVAAISGTMLVLAEFMLIGAAAIAGKKVFIVIWTTTPWTIPANLAVALHPDFTYAAVDVGGGEVFILARELIDTCMSSFQISDYEILAEIDGVSGACRDEAAVDAIVTAALRVLDLLRQHEAEESDLIQGAIGDDLGVGD